MKQTIIRLILAGFFIGLACTVVSMFTGLLIYFIVLSTDIPLAITVLKYTSYTSFAIGIVAMFSVYIYVAVLVKQFIKNGIKL